MHAHVIPRNHTEYQLDPSKDKRLEAYTYTSVAGLKCRNLDHFQGIFIFNNSLSSWIFLNKVLQKFSMAQPSSSVAKHKLLRDTKKQQDVITSNRAIMTS